MPGEAVAAMADRCQDTSFLSQPVSMGVSQKWDIGRQRAHSVAHGPPPRVLTQWQRE